VRVADQMWISRARTVALAVGGVVCFALLLLWLGTVEGRPLDWGEQGVKLLALVAMSAALAAVATQPWDVQARTTEARDLIMRLEAQSLELDLARRRAEEANRAKSDFLARMSHELRTPLNSVVGFTNVLLRKADGRDHDYLTRIRDNGTHLLGLIDDILDLARIEAGRIEVELQEMDLATLVRETVDQLEGKALASGVALVERVPRGLGPLRADDARLRQVLINLVGNAIKFTPQGRVDVEVEAGPDGRPERLHVRDTGIGIARDRLASIFHPFEQADGTISRKYGGTGLGLAVSRSLCELMGFALSVESEEGRGSVFTISFRPPSPTSPA
jgi:signal transduction histidine kinase